MVDDSSLKRGGKSCRLYSGRIDRHLGNSRMLNSRGSRQAKVIIRQANLWGLRICFHNYGGGAERGTINPHKTRGIILATKEGQLASLVQVLHIHIYIVIYICI